MANYYNRIQLRGTVVAEPTFSHESYDQKYYIFPLSVQRQSGQADVVNIHVTEQQIAELLPMNGKRYDLEGHVCSYNNGGETWPKVIIFVGATSIEPTEEPEDINSVILSGKLSRDPNARYTPLGKYICDVSLQIKRPHGKSDYLPCISWGNFAGSISKLRSQDPLAFEGRLQSRIYSKNVDGVVTERIAYEVSIMRPCRLC